MSKIIPSTTNSTEFARSVANRVWQIAEELRIIADEACVTGEAELVAHILKLSHDMSRAGQVLARRYDRSH